MQQGVIVTVSQEQVNHVNKVLHSAPEKALTVYRRAFERGLNAARVQASREIRKRYDISDSNLRTYQNIQSRVQTQADGVVGYINFSSAKIPLYRFHPSPSARKYTTRYVNGISGWRVTTEVSAADTRGAMIRRRAAFIATFQSGHTGMFYRTGGKTSSGKAEIREYFGYSTADMLDYPEAREAVQERAAEIVRSRIDHELLRALDELG